MPEIITILVVSVAVVIIAATAAVFVVVAVVLVVIVLFIVIINLLLRDTVNCYNVMVDWAFKTNFLPFSESLPRTGG